MLKWRASVWRLVFSLAISWSVVRPAAAQTGQTIYGDALQNGWQNYGWTQINYNNTTPVHLGSYSISVTITQGWQAIYIAHSAFNSSPYLNLSFWLHGGTSGGQQLQIQGHAGGAAQTAVALTAPIAGNWTQYTVSLASLGVANRTDMDGFWIQTAVNAPQPTFYLDDITLTTNANPGPTITLTAPGDGSSYAAPATIPLAATVVTNGHTITKVQFWNSTNLLNESTTSPYSFNWTNVAIGSYGLFARVIYDSAASADSTTANVTVTGTTPVSIVVDAQLNRHPISPLIYGTAFASSTQLSDLNFTVNRSGGNAETRYNWVIDAHNRAADWYFESIADGPGTPAASDDTFVSDTKNGGAQPALTIPMIGWVPKLGSGRNKLASYSISKYGPQTGSDSDAGNGVGTNATANTSWLITTNNPNDANFATNSLMQQALVQHLTNRWGVSTNGGVGFYLMDNEHSIWHSTHRDIHPNGASRQEIRDKMFDYASIVKGVDPNAVVLGPEEFGWSGYFYSGADLQYAGTYGWSYLPDRSTNGNMDYVCWLLNEFHKRDTNTGQRLLDYFTLHRYTEDGNVGGNDTSTDTQLKRNRWTRSFWDTNYVDESWIGSQTINKVMLIPRMKNWVDTYYPGTKTGITEYNWGAEASINGATTEADILGIFGREGLDLATRWTTPDPTTPTYKAMKIYRNYDGNKSVFGDLNINATGPNPDSVSVFGALRSSDGALTLMVINKQLTSAATAAVTLTNRLLNGTGKVWQLTSANTITRLSDISFAGTTFTSTVPAQSITLFVLPAGAPPPPPQLRAGKVTGGTFDFWLDGTAGQRYVLQSSTDLRTWTTVQTNTIPASSWHITQSAGAARFYRAFWAP